MKSFSEFIFESAKDSLTVKNKKTGKTYSAIEYTGINQWPAIQFVKGSKAKIGRNEYDDTVIFLHGKDEGDEFTVKPGEFIVKLSAKEFIKVHDLGYDYVKHEDLPFEILSGTFEGRESFAVQFTKQIDPLDLYELFLINTNAELTRNPKNSSERAVMVTSGMFDDEEFAVYGDYLVKQGMKSRKVFVVKKEDFKTKFKQ